MEQFFSRFGTRLVVVIPDRQIWLPGFTSDIRFTEKFLFREARKRVLTVESSGLFGSPRQWITQ
jgi:hypothetical protein